MVRLLKYPLALAAVVAGLLLVGGFLGHLHPAGDSLAVFRFGIAVVLLAASGLLWATGARRAGLAGAAIALLATATLVPHWWPLPGQARAAAPTLTVYQKNLWFGLRPADAVVADIRASGADIVTLQEVGPRSIEVAARVSDLYPTQIACPFSTVGGVAILSRFPDRADTRICRPGTGLVSSVFETPAGPVRAASLHLHWPWPHGQQNQVAALLPLLQTWQTPAVIGGDFNMVRWSHAMRTIARATGTSPVGRSRITLRNKGLVMALPIDHVLVTGGQGTTELRPTAGSDHNGIVARVVLPRD